MSGRSGSSPITAHSNFENKLLAGDAFEIMRQMPGKSVDLIVADPPYNLGKNFGNNRDKKQWDDYKAFTVNWIGEAVRILKDSGSLYIFMGVGFIARLFILLQDNFGLHFNSWIVWHYTQGMGRRKGFSPRHEDILYFTRSRDFLFNLDAVRIPQKYYRKRNNMAGANPGDVWHFSHIHYCSRERERHPTQKPEALMERIIKTSSLPGQLVLDPFVGSGTTCRVARVLNRKYSGIDINPEYIHMAEKRIDQPFERFDSVDERIRYRKRASYPTRDSSP
jgi:site-specific DNA-methyltransferase (adenine-specific)